MADRYKPWFTCLLCISLCSALIGCNRGGDGSQSPAAAIDGKNKDATPESGDNAPAGNKQNTDPKHPAVIIETSLGNITIQLDRENSPITVDNFLDYVGKKHYDQTIVHQVFNNQGFLAGGYGADLFEKPANTPIRNEAHNGLKNLRGTVSMVRFPDAIDSATCQFFVNVSDNPALDHKDRGTAEGYGYCVFGKVIDGMDVVDKINAVPVHDKGDLERTPVDPVVIKSIRWVR